MSRRKRQVFGLGLATAAVVIMVAASTAYACVYYYGELTVDGSVQDSSLMIADEGQHGYCSGEEPTAAAVGPASSTVSATFDPASSCNSSGTNELPDGDYDIKLRNTTSGFTQSGSAPWSLQSGAGCWSGSTTGTVTWLGDVTITSGSGSGSWTIPSGAGTNGTSDASVFCVGKQTSGDDSSNGSQAGFLAPFRVNTV